MARTNTREDIRVQKAVGFLERFPNMTEDDDGDNYDDDGGGGDDGDGNGDGGDSDGDCDDDDYSDVYSDWDGNGWQWQRHG